MRLTISHLNSRINGNTMTRHGKNCTAGAVYTYHEKRKDTGTKTGSMKPCFPLFLTLAPCVTVSCQKEHVIFCLVLQYSL